jgi:hypothetical protein
MSPSHPVRASPSPSPGSFPRAYLPWLWLLLAAHAVLLVWAALRALGVEREDYLAREFRLVGITSFVVALVGLTLGRHHARAFAIACVAIAAAALLTPGAVAVVSLCLLSAHVLGMRLLRIVGGRAGTAYPAAPWPLPILIGIGIWIAMVTATGGLRIHYAPVYVVVLLVPLAFAWRDTVDALARLRPLAAAGPVFGWTERIWVALLVTMIVLHLFIVARPDAGYDSSTMHLQFAILVEDMHRWRFDVDRYAWAVMPLGADWAYAIAYILGGENAARLANFSFGVLAMGLVFELLRRHARREIALASVCLLVSIPLAFAETGSLYVENLWSAFLLAALFVTLDMARGSLPAARGWPLWALLAAAAMQCKVIGVLWLAPLFVYTLVAMTRRADAQRPDLRGLLVMTGATVMAAWPYVNAWLRTGNPVFPFMNTLFRSPLADITTSFTNPLYVVPLRPWSLYEVIADSHRFIEGSDGAIGLHWLLLLPLIALAFTRRRPAEQWWCAALAAVFFTAVFVQQAYLRYLLPAFMLLAVLGGWAANDLPDGRRTRIAVLIVGGLLCLLHVRLIPNGNWPNARLCVGCAFDAQARTNFLSMYMGDRIVGDHLNRNLPDARVGFLMLNAPSPGGFAGYSRAANWHDGPFFSAVARATTAADIDVLVRKYSLTHVVYRTRAPERENDAIRAFRDSRTTPLWKFQDFVVAAITPP